MCVSRCGELQFFRATRDPAEVKKPGCLFTMQENHPGDFSRSAPAEYSKERNSGQTAMTSIGLKIR